MLIRLANSVDAEALAAIYAPYCTSSIISFEEVAPTASEMAQRLHKILPRYPWLVLEEERIAGYAYAGPHRERAAYRWAVDVTVYVHSDFHRRGVGTALYVALFAVLTAQGYHRAYAGVALPNPGSTGLHEAMGFEVVGDYRQVGWKLGGWHDVRWYQRTLRDGEPGPIRSVDEVVPTPAWDQAMTAGLARYDRGRSRKL